MTEPSFVKDYAGLWTDANGNLLAVQRGIGISFIQDEYCFVVDKININANGAFYCRWFGRKPVMRSSTTAITATFFDPDAPESSPKTGEGLITPGTPNGRGQIHNFQLDFRSFSGSSMIYGGFGYICPTTNVTMAGTFGGEIMKISLDEKAAKGDAAKDEVHEYSGTIEINALKGIVKATSRFLAGQGEIINPVTNAVVGNISMAWCPSKKFVSQMMNSEDYRTDNLRLYVYLKDKTFPNGAFRDLKRNPD